MDRELWNQFAQVLTRHGSDPQNIKFAYSMEELMLQLAFYGGYTILAEPVLAQLPANKNLTFIPLENDTVPAWAVWNRENISAHPWCQTERWHCQRNSPPHIDP